MRKLGIKSRDWKLRYAEKMMPFEIPGISPVISKILSGRGIQDLKQAHIFLKPELKNLVEPSSIKGIKESVEKIKEAIENKKKIVIYGDYDVDGIAGVVILVRLFELLKYPVNYYIPHRINEGYGLNKTAIKKLKEDGANLIITVDCGISSKKEVQYAKDLGIDIIITDHHEPNVHNQALPEAVSIINPKLTDESFIRDLCGTGVAFKLAWAILNNFSFIDRSGPLFHRFIIDAITLAAIGTIADVVPLIGENRILVYYGLQSLKACKIPGLKALMNKTRISGKEIQPKDIAYGLAPRLNAGGRLSTATKGVELLLSESDTVAEEIAKYLDMANRERQKIEVKILEEVRFKIQEEYDLSKNPILVVASDAWHPGVIGIVASRIAEEFYRPAIIISTTKNIGKGSGRSIPGFHLYNALNSCNHLFESFGGHALAAGLEIKTELIPELISHLSAQTNITPLPVGSAPILIDSEIELSNINRKLSREIDMLQPFGEGNPEPVLATHNVNLAGQPRLMGRNADHLEFFVKQNNKAFRVVAFGQGQQIDIIESLKDEGFSIAYNIRFNDFNGKDDVELHLKDIKYPNSKQ
ncbi:MAG: single-stranded-DNA-specific exonuclease RecJ [Candidatus Brocadiia bacterium]